MSHPPDARQLAVLLRISESLDIVGDVSATVENPAELLAWASVLPDCSIFAWRGHVSGNRFVHVTAVHKTNPIHGRVTATLRADHHRAYWNALVPENDLKPGDEQPVTLKQLSAAWEAMPIEVPE